MKRILVLVTLAVLIPFVTLAQTTPNNLTTFLSRKLPQPIVTQEDFLRVLPALLGFGSRINFNDPIEKFILLLAELGVVEPGFVISPISPLTKGWASIVKVKALGISPGLIDWVQIKLNGLTPGIAFKMAKGAGVMAPGETGDFETGLEFASECVAIASLAHKNPKAGANVSAILEIIQGITTRVVDIKTCNSVIPGLVIVPTS